MTKPVEPVPAIGILNVCDAPIELILKKFPDVPVWKFCVLSVRPFKFEIAEDAAVPHVSPVAEDVSIFKT